MATAPFKVGITIDPPPDKLFGDLTQNMHLRIAKGARTWAERLSSRGKIALRQDVRQAGLGDRLANTWRAEIYPKSASAHTHSPAVLFKSTAPEIITAHSAETVILPRRGMYLAIPTENVPRRGRAGGLRGQASHLTVKEVEQKYGQKLILIPPKGDRHKGPSGPGGQYSTLLGCIDKSFNRRQARDRKRKQPRGNIAPIKDVAFLSVMFVFVRQVRLRQRLHWEAIFKDLEAFATSAWPEEIAAAVNAGSN